MNYLKIKWRHTFPDEPIWLYSELDDDRWEVRKMEVFPDGTMGYADRLQSFGDTRLGEEALPALADIASDPQFESMATTPQE